MPIAIFDMAAKSVMNVRVPAEIVCINRGVVDIAKTFLGLCGDIDSESFVRFYAPLKRFKISIVPVAGIGIAKPVAIIGKIARQGDHPAGATGIIDVGNRCPGRVVVVDIPAENRTSSAWSVAPSSYTADFRRWCSS